MKTLFADDVLQYLYRSGMFQQLEEEEQVAFLDDFVDDEQFMKAVAVAVDFQHQLGKIEAAVPEIGEFSTEHHSVIQDYVQADGNIAYFPFGEKVDLAAPLVVALHTSEALKAYDVQVKGLLLPLLELCAEQKRDLAVLLNGEEFVFPHGQIKRVLIRKMRNISLGENYPLTALLVQAECIFARSIVKEDAELLFITAEAVQLSTLQVQCLKNRSIELSVIALDTEAFEQGETTGFDKAYFPNSGLANRL